MKPLDPRLLRQAEAARGYLAGAVVFGLATTALVLAQAGLIAHVLAHADRGAAALSASLTALAAVVAARALVAHGSEATALRAAAATKSQLRRRVLRRIIDLGPQWLGGRSQGELIALAGRGLDALDPYFARYLPQLVLSVIVPVAVLARIAGADLTSAVVIGVTLPLIPVFMVLIGMHTQARTDRQWTLLRRLAGHFLDVVEGLPTLKAFGRAKAQAETIRKVTEDHRQVTMGILRVTFLSALVLELLATLSVALVAVEVGLRLLAGHLDYESALLVLLLAPEAYLPLRAVGAQYHAAQEGVTAAADVLDILDTEPASPIAASDDRPAVPDLRREAIRFDRVRVRYPNRDRDAVSDITLVLQPGEHVAVVGETGAGKSTLLGLLLGFVQPTEGAVSIGDGDLRAFDAEALAAVRRQIAWVPQHAHLFAGSIADNVRLGRPEATDEEVVDAISTAGLADFIRVAPNGLQTTVGERGMALSTGERQRVAVARALLCDAPVLLLDEPGAHLDEATSAGLLAALREYAIGRTLVVVTHNPAWTVDADRMLEMVNGRLVSERSPAEPARNVVMTGSGGTR